MKITIDTHHCSREELEELKSYLNKESWDFTTDEPKEEKEIKYILSEDGILIVGSHGITLNDKIRDEGLHEYYIEERSELISNLITWIGEIGLNSSRAGDKQMMTNDLEMLMARDETYLFSSNSTNSYIFEGDSEFDDTCKELIEINENIKKKEDLIEMWLDAEEENRKHTPEGEAKCIELKEKFIKEIEELSDEDKQYVKDYLDDLAA